MCTRCAVTNWRYGLYKRQDRRLLRGPRRGRRRGGGRRRSRRNGGQHQAARAPEPVTSPAAEHGPGERDQRSARRTGSGNGVPVRAPGTPNTPKLPAPALNTLATGQFIEHGRTDRRAKPPSTRSQPRVWPGTAGWRQTPVATSPIATAPAIQRAPIKADLPHERPLERRDQAISGRDRRRTKSWGGRTGFQ